MANHLEAEQLIKARLFARVPSIDSKHIFSAADLEGVKERSQATPALHLLYAGDNVIASSSGNGQAQEFEQLWNVVVVVRNVRDISGEATRLQSGEIIDSVLKALQGWNPSPAHSKLKRKSSPYRPTYRNGFAYFSFQFSTQMNITGLGND